MTDSPLRRAARALCEADNLDPDEQVRKPEAVQYARSVMRSSIPMCARWETYQHKARAVLQAVWEPSDSMIAAAEDTVTINHPADVWPAMIDAAIAEG